RDAAVPAGGSAGRFLPFARKRRVCARARSNAQRHEARLEGVARRYSSACPRGTRATWASWPDFYLPTSRADGQQPKQTGKRRLKELEISHGAADSADQHGELSMTPSTRLPSFLCFTAFAALVACSSDKNKAAD